jgi:hypothetical protein
MSTWGVENYLARNRPFMPAAIARFRPPLLIGNRAELIPGTGNYGMLLEQDREIIETRYLPYWGTIRVAGAAGVIDAQGSARLELPFAGRYRLESHDAIRIDGALVKPGETVVVDEARLALEVTPGAVQAAGGPVAFRLIWAAARPPPAAAPVALKFYDGL